MPRLNVSDVHVVDNNYTYLEADPETGVKVVRWMESCQITWRATSEHYSVELNDLALSLECLCPGKSPFRGVRVSAYESSRPLTHPGRRLSPSVVIKPCCFIPEGFRNKMRHIHFRRFLFYWLKQ